MVNDLVKLLGGSIELQSQVGERARFEVNFPLKRAKSGTASSHVNRSLSEVMAKEIQAAPDSPRDQRRDKSFQLCISKAESHRQVKESLRLHLIQWFFDAGDSRKFEDMRFRVLSTKSMSMIRRHLVPGTWPSYVFRLYTEV
jgi:hypothetical protein